MASDGSKHASTGLDPVYQQAMGKKGSRFVLRSRFNDGDERRSAWNVELRFGKGRDDPFQLFTLRGPVGKCSFKIPFYGALELAQLLRQQFNGVPGDIYCTITDASAGATRGPPAFAPDVREDDPVQHIRLGRHQAVLRAPTTDEECMSRAWGLSLQFGDEGCESKAPVQTFVVRGPSGKTAARIPMQLVIGLAGHLIKRIASVKDDLDTDVLLHIRNLGARC